MRRVVELLGISPSFYRNTYLYDHLQALGVSATSIHIIGVSLGAHVGGLVGHFHDGQLGQITGMVKLRLRS